MKFLTALLTVLFLSIGCQSDFNAHSLLPFDPNIHHGKLSNGLQYFVLKNTEPKDRVYIRLVVNAGSMHEDDDQKGIAHLVEHMAFNGSKKYPENQIIFALEKLGMKFARDINAFTDFENTVYTLNLDQNSPQKLALAFDVVNEWMNHLTFLPKDVDGERGVVQEEWRRRLSPMLRIGDKKSAVEMAGSRYALRDPIGDMQIIRTIAPTRVADFYHKWYRPDNMSIIVVGDIDPQSIIHQLEKTLNQTANTTSPLEKIDFSIPLVKHWRVASVAEQGTNIPSIEFSFFENAQDTDTIDDYKQELIHQIATRLINLRLQEWEKSQKTIESANFYRTHLGKETWQTVFSLPLSETQYSSAINALFDFIAELHQQGFSQRELNQEVQRLTRLNQKQRNLRNGSLKIADDLIVAAANQQVVLSAQTRYALNERLLPQITLQDLQQYINALFNLKAKLVLVTQPLPEKPLPFNATDLETRWQQAMSTPQSQWQNEKQSAKRPHLNIPQGALTQEKYWEKGDITEFRLSNGSKLIYHYSEKTPNQVHFRAITQGGLRSIPNNAYHLLRAAVSIVDDSGIGGLSHSDIAELTKDPLVLATVIDDDKQGFSGVAKNKDLETLLTLFRLKLQSAVISQDAFYQFHRENDAYFKQMDIETHFMQAVSKQRFPNVETVYSQPKFGLIHQDTIHTLYSHYILGKTDFTYFIIGDISPEQVKTLAEKYLANVDIKTQSRPYTLPHIHTPRNAFTMKGLKEPRADVEIYLTQSHPWQAEEKDLLEILGDIVQEKLRLVLREKAAGIYSVNSWFSQDHLAPQVEGKIEFSCDPARADELIGLTHQVLDEIIEKGIDESLLRKKIHEQQTQIKQQFDTLVSITSMIEESYNQQGNPQAIYLYQQLDQLATKAKIEQLARQILAKDGRFVAVLKP